MSEQSNAGQVTHNEAASRFEISMNGHLAVAEYERSGQSITFDHTVVPPELGGRGLGTQLAKACMAHAREAGLQVIPACSFIAAYMRKHAETHDLVHPEHRATIGL